MLPLILATGFFAEWAAAWGSNIGALILLVIGMVLIVIEMLIPGFGVAAELLRENGIAVFGESAVEKLL